MTAQIQPLQSRSNKATALAAGAQEQGEGQGQAEGQVQGQGAVPRGSTTLMLAASLPVPAFPPCPPVQPSLAAASAAEAGQAQHSIGDPGLGGLTRNLASSVSPGSTAAGSAGDLGVGADGEEQSHHTTVTLQADKSAALPSAVTAEQPVFSGASSHTQAQAVSAASAQASSPTRAAAPQSPAVAEAKGGPAGILSSSKNAASVLQTLKVSSIMCTGCVRFLFALSAPFLLTGLVLC